MELIRRRTRAGSVSKSALLCWVFICLFSACALITVTQRSVHLGDQENRSSRSDSSTQGELVRRRELSGGPGSYPPRCASKCGTCTPCSPVHVPVPPGTPVTTEYYPEAWRCKCGNKLYMP
ncbi:EPIDERMAL PATTERNING FACTOR-like protein 4 [Elaeis guineensis]|uniref:Epidermal patterning factor-like protein n=1 Tax=Elaeis guineensis var. tenera TaxID=51953 RepID=A0A6I9R9S6_ELAGV|nr:EPIDERMAL PATTERNING FACTOR-like protein 4 [Elaeis guineensis]